MIILRQRNYATSDYEGLSKSSRRELRKDRDRIAKDLLVWRKANNKSYKNPRIVSWFLPPNRDSGDINARNQKHIEALDYAKEAKKYAKTRALKSDYYLRRLELEKDFSRKSTQVLYKIGKLRNKLDTFPAEITKNYFEKRGNLKQRAIADLRIKEGTKSKVQLMKDAINKERKIRTNMNEALIASNTPEGTKKYIGDKAGNFVQHLSENPISTASVAVGYGSTPIQVATGTYWGPIGEAGIAAEKALKNRSQRYRQVTSKTADLAKKRHWKDRTSRAVQTVLGTLG